MKRTIMHSYLFAVFVTLAFCSCEKSTIATRTDFVLGTICTIEIPASTNAEQILDGCFAELRRLESILSANTENSELGRVNKIAHTQPVKVSGELFELLVLARKISLQTNGAFNPALGEAVKLWGIGFENERLPEKSEIENALKSTALENIELDKSGTVFLRKPETQIDLGAIAKGYAADKIAALLKAENIQSALIDLGGNIYVLGKKFHTGSDWVVGLRAPDGKQNDVAMKLTVHDTSVVTSGVYERFFFKDGIRYHHVLDPKTGWPTDNHILSVSVVCESSAYADALATAFLVLGYEQSAAIVQATLDMPVKVIFMFDNGTHRIIEGSRSKRQSAAF